MIKVFIDGAEGTTGLRLHERLALRDDIRLLKIAEEDRKNPSCRREMLSKADFAFLCLPDMAAKEAVSLSEDSNVRIIDASTAHRTESGWAYGFPELGSQFYSNIEQGNRVAVPGCHAGGFLALVYPLVASGVLPVDYPVTATSITGFSGGGKKMINDYATLTHTAPSQYATEQTHKHLKEMTAISGLSAPPVFQPFVAPFYSGMQVSLPLRAELLGGISKGRLIELYHSHYEGSRLISVVENKGESIDADEMRGKDSMKIIVCGSGGRLVAVALFDNLGKGASGAAVQCFNIMSGVDETTGLNL